MKYFRSALCLSIALLAIAPDANATHSLGTAQDIAPFPIPVGGGAVVYNDPGALFLVLRLTAAPGSAGDRVRITRPAGDDDVLDLVPGQQIWSRPLPGDSVTLQYLDNGNGAGGASIDRTGRGTIIDLFDESGFSEPAFTNGGLCTAGNPDWDDVACLSAANPTENLIKTTARSVGMFVMVTDKVTSCSATLIDDDLILTAAHCVSETNFPPGDVSDQIIASGSFTLDFQAAACDGAPSATSTPRFFKLVRAVRTGFTDPPDSGLDYAVVQIDTSPAGGGGLGVPPIQIRTSTTPLSIGDSLFGVHHPRGSRKKVSQALPTPLCSVTSTTSSTLSFNCDVDNGSSGSSIFDASGRIVAVADWAGGCSNSGQASRVVRPDFLTPLPLAADVDTVAVFDRSGSMNLPAPGGSDKLTEAKEAASLFFDLLRTDSTHQAGLVTFNQAPSTNHDLAPITTTTKDQLIGPPHPGKVESITAGGMTSIGGGLERARQRLDAHGAANTPTILLMTDGLQNTAPMIQDVENSLGDARICAVGFGSEASLDGPLLTKLARDHGGLYTRADRGLDLRKFFALCFGDIFESGISMDPNYHLHKGQTKSEEIPIPVCGETDLTVVVAWEDPFSLLVPSLRTPGGVVVDASTAGVESSSGRTWSYLRFRLPLLGERDGTWILTVTRPRGSGEFSRPLDHEDFAVVSIVDGGPKLRAVRERLYYTGDVFAPLATLRDADGNLYAAEMTVEVQRPEKGTGNLLTESGLSRPRLVDGDQLDARVSTLLSLESAAGGQLIPTSTFALSLLDDGVQDEGAMEPDGQYGARAPNLLTNEGNYTLHARARFGNGCTAQREAFWTTYVAVGVDPGRTEVDTEVVGTLSDGRERVRVVVTPRDRYGNYVGPGRGDALDFGDRPGSEVLGDPTDRGDGSYEVDVAWDPASGEPPGVGVVQPERPSVDLPGERPEGSAPASSGRAFGIAFGSALPAGSSNFELDPGFGARLSYRHKMSHRSSFVAALGYAGFDGDGAADVALFDLSVAGRLDSAPDDRARFFLRGGLGYYAPETDAGGGSAGAHLGIGAAIPVRRDAAGKPRIELEMSLAGHRLFDDDDPDFVRALVGVSIRD